MSYPIPQWRVVLDGTDLTERIAPRLLDLTLTECRGGEADQLDLRIHDHDGKMALPKRGVRLAVALGWKATGLVEKGTFTVDEVEYSGAPDITTVRARSADLTAKVRTRRERSWHNTTLGAVLNTLAGEHGLTPRVAEALARTKLTHLDQANESDMNLLTRLGHRFDAVATVKGGALVFAPIGANTNAPPFTVATASNRWPKRVSRFMSLSLAWSRWVSLVRASASATRGVSPCSPASVLSTAPSVVLCQLRSRRVRTLAVRSALRARTVVMSGAPLYSTSSTVKVPFSTRPVAFQPSATARRTPRLGSAILPSWSWMRRSS